MLHHIGVRLCLDNRCRYVTAPDPDVLLDPTPLTKAILSTSSRTEINARLQTGSAGHARP